MCLLMDDNGNPKHKILFQNLTLGYLTKTLNQIIFTDITDEDSKHNMWWYYDCVVVVVFRQ
jgi:hypothetical protein